MADKNSTARSMGLRANKAIRENMSSIARFLMPTLPVGAAVQAAPLANTLFGQSSRVAARDFVEGLAGKQVAPVAAALTAPRSAAKMGSSVTIDLPLSKAPAAPKLTSKDLTPAERQAAFVATLFKGPLSMEEAVAASGMMQAPGKPRTDKDLAIGDAASASKLAYEQAIAAASAEPDTAKAQELTRNATIEFFNRMATLGGRRPACLARTRKATDALRRRRVHP